ncbi:NAD(P)/FAD-dependent oxidoreductase [Streptacidiphilus pinicola]|uniref:NAD(P)/FAD-dependent oxidoreductase n=1 Tax=Streptacidiphilus pinicola TaxID=2219663 RepID=A0A2X0IEB2_9ACTN|nr:NAD(P)/FAD-dependent oxidoreductase [Streptacidiphilus pinicola]RAG83324.1 NAD(P)/FAD-dependent oxidoreductase [Streptacidiphilus pinicola]
MACAPRIVIVGVWHGGMHVALRLKRLLRPGEATVTVVDAHAYMTYQPLLAEAAAGSLEPRHVVVPLRQALPWAQIITRQVLSLDHAQRTVYLRSTEGSPSPLRYDRLVWAPGSVSRLLPVPGLAEHGNGFKTVAEAIHLRNQVLGRLDAAAATSSAERRAAALTFVFVGGGFAGVEALAELQDMAHDACARYPELDPRAQRWILVEAADRILPEVGQQLSRYTADLLRRRGIDVRLGTRLLSAEGVRIRLDDGTEFDADTLVWTAGVAPSPLNRRTDLPLDERGRVRTTAFLSVVDTEDAWAVGDCAAVPDLAAGQGELCPPSAQHAVRQARVTARNVVASLRSGEPVAYRHASVGTVASLGLYQGAAEIRGVRLRGFPAWFAHRSYHLSQLPSANRRLRVVADWTLALFFPREIVSLASLEHTHDDFASAADQARPPEP